MLTDPQVLPCSLLSQEIIQFLQIYLCHRHFHNELIFFTFALLFYSHEKFSAKPWYNSFVLLASEKGIGLASPRLSVGEQAAIVALPRILEHVRS